MSSRLATRVLNAMGIGAQVHDAYMWALYLTRPKLLKRNRQFKRVHNGPNVPSPALVYKVTGWFDVPAFVRTGAEELQRMRALLARNELEIETFERVLDFGCGSGRLIRHWPRNGVSLYGCDYNERLIAWCRKHLPFAQFTTNRLAPPLSYPDAAFDFVYAYSVFTHLPRDLQRPWMLEMYRVIAPGGHLYVTLHGDERAHQLSAEDQATYRAGELVIRQAQYAGRNQCNAYHPDSYVRGDLVSGLFEVLDHEPANEVNRAAQDVYLLQRSRG